MARRRDYFPERLALFTRHNDQLTQVQPNCPGSAALGALVRAVDDLRGSADGNETADRETQRAVANAGNRWRAARRSGSQFAPP